MNEFIFNSTSLSIYKNISDSLKHVYKTNCPVIICVGSDLAVGDSLGPIIGTNLHAKLFGKAYVYGTLESPMTAKEVETLKNVINYIHPKSKILVIDAAVGEKEDIGNIKLFGDGIRPGLGVNKNLSKIGDASIIAVVAKKGSDNKELLLETRFSLIYKLTNIIVNAIIEYFA